jgi:thiamine-phosphate pyrophosphorylase
MAALQTPMNDRLRGLYAITGDRGLGSERLVAEVELALTGGARIVQYRDKSNDRARRRSEASAIVAACRRHGALAIINDDIELAAAVAADGVHLGRDDRSIAQARFRLPAGTIIGASCYNRFDYAQAAARAGADYVAFGSFFLSPTKPQAVRAEPELLQRARRELHLPTVAIGGIRPENGAALVRAGADMLAVISAVFAAPDIAAAASAFTSCFTIAEENPP